MFPGIIRGHFLFTSISFNNMNVLISADIHINDYSSYNYSYRSRLGQFDKLADRLVEIGKEKMCRELWLLGDILDKPYSSHPVNHCLKRFLGKLTSNFSEVRYILGQHDMSCKSDDQSEEDTLITIFDFEDMVYMDKKILDLDGHKFGFMNWKSSQDLSWLGDTHLDILLGHYTKSDMFGQDIDESKFDLMIHGDIHNDQVIGKFVSVGNPIQHDLKSMQNGSCIILDTNTLKWERVRTDPDHTRFLRISYTNSEDKAGFESELQYNVYKPDIDLLSQENNLDGNVESTLNQNKVLTWNDVDDLILKVCEEKGIPDIHREIESTCDPFEEIDFDFEITRVHIQGYLSIIDEEFTLHKGDRIALMGDIGTGKSSTLNAIADVFKKRNRDIIRYKSRFCDKINVTVSLYYQNKLFEITKGDDWKLVIDGNEQHYGGVREFEEDLPTKLPFVKYINLFFIRKGVDDLTSQFNETTRIDLISRFYRLDRIQSYYNTCDRKYKDLIVSIKNKESDLKSKNEVISYIDKRIGEITYAEDYNIELLKIELDKVVKDKSLVTEREIWENKVKSIKENLDNFKDKLINAKSRISDDIESDKSELENLKSQLEKVNSMYEDMYKRSVQFESDLKELNGISEVGKDLRERYESLKNGRCSECGSILSDENHKRLLSEYESKISKLRDTFKVLSSRLKENPNGRDSKEYYVDALSKLKSKFDEIKKYIEIISNKIYLSNMYSGQVSEIKEDISKYESSLKEILNNEPDKVSDPISILVNRETEIRGKIAVISELNKLLVDKKDKEDEVLSLRSEIESTETIVNKYKNYLEIVSLNGIVMEEILKNLASKFSNEEVKYKVESGVFRGERFIKFKSYFNVRGYLSDYEFCSSGQKVTCDIYFLKMLFKSPVGILTLDEFMGVMDPESFDKMCSVLTKELNVNTVLISTHNINMSQYNRKFIYSLNDEAKTEINIT